MERQLVSEEAKASARKVPLFDDFRQLAAVRATRQPAPLPDTETFGQRFAGLINREHASEHYEEY